MNSETRDMFDQNGNLIQLIDVLSEFKDNDFNWSILDFYGVGQAPNDLSMSEFENVIRSDSTGFKMKWDELLAFARNLEQTFDCLIVAIGVNSKFNAIKLAQDDFSSCEVVIQAFDCMEWTIQKAS